VTTGSSHFRPGRFAIGSHPGMFGVVRPRTPTLTPPSSFTTYSGNAGLPSPVWRVFAESQGKEESLCARRRTSRPKLNSWFPTAIAS
jgi:hypothetical protein